MGFWELDDFIEIYLSNEIMNSNEHLASSSSRH